MRSKLYIKDLLEKGWEMVGEETFPSWKLYTMRKYTQCDFNVRDGYDEYWHLIFSIGQGVSEPFAKEEYHYEEKEIYTGELCYQRFGGMQPKEKTKLCEYFSLNSPECVDALELLFRIPKFSSKRLTWGNL